MTSGRALPEFRPSPRRSSDGRTPESVAIGILTWNGYDLARACLMSLQRLSTWPHPTVVVDNGSREPIGRRLAEEFGAPVESVTLPTNELVAGGYNAILRWGLETNAGHILLLNDDTLVTDSEMVRTLAAVAAPDVAVVGPLILNADGSHFSAGGKLGRWTGRSGHLRRHEMRAKDRPYPVPWVDGPCMLVNLAAARKVGGLDPAFVSTWEELDWCIRAGDAGYRCLVEPRTAIRHLRGQTIPSHQSQEYLLRNALLFARRHRGLVGNVTAGISLIYITVPELLLFGSLDLHRMGSIVAAAGSAIRWNVADAVSQRRWLTPARGPKLSQDP